MKQNYREHISAFLHVASIFPIFLMASFVEFSLPLPIKIAASLGIFLLGLGGSVMLWATLHLKEGVTGEVKPETEGLVREGPYRFVRHPMYLGMIIAFLGFFVWMRNVTGMIGVFSLFLPSAVYRAKLEEEALSQEFGTKWENYVGETGFILPPLRKDEHTHLH